VPNTLTPAAQARTFRVTAGGPLDHQFRQRTRAQALHEHAVTGPSEPPGVRPISTVCPATTQRVAAFTAPPESVAPIQNAGLTSGPGNHIVRSTTIGTPLVDVSAVETSTLASARRSPGN
jgi:hypothetical protein